MTLITDAKDERLTLYESDGVEYGLAQETVMASLRGALAERDRLLARDEVWRKKKKILENDLAVAWAERTALRAENERLKEHAGLAEAELDATIVTGRKREADITALRADYRELVEAGEGAARIARERARQKSAEGWTPKHDSQHSQGELTIVGACYALNKMPAYQAHWFAETVEWWPWHPDWDKRDKHSRERSLEIAGALIAAELDRLAALAKVEGT